MDIKDRLNQLAELQAHREVLRLDLQAKRDAVLAPVAGQLKALADEYEPMFAVADEQIARLTEEVKAAVIAAGESVKGERLQAVWVKGRTSWDTKAIEGYSAAHPEIERFKKVGEPSVTIRTV